MKNRIITISRQLGSGGREIGHRLAEREGFKYYDKELLALISRQSGITPEVIESYDEKPARSFLFSVAASTSYASFYSGIEMPLNQKIFLAQFDTIKKVAEEGECVIVGRCADYVL